MNRLKLNEEENKRQKEECFMLKNELKIKERKISDLIIENRHLKDAEALL